MPQTHKLVRDAVLALLSDADYGFNAKLAAVLGDYGIHDTVEISWAMDAQGVAYARMSRADFAVSRLKGRLTLEVAPDGSEWTGETKGVKWSGRVGVRLVFRVRYPYRDGDENPLDDDLMTSLATAVEDAVIEVFQRRTPAISWGSFAVIYAKPPDCPEGYGFDPLEDGCELTIPMKVGFRVDVDY